MKSPHDVYLPAVMSRVLIRWIIYTAVGLVALGTYVYVTDSANRANVVPTLLCAALFWVAIGWTSTWLDPVHGTLATVRWRLYHRRVPLRPGTGFALVVNRRKDVLLRVQQAGAVRCHYVQLLRRDRYVQKSLDPTLLHLLADTLVHHAPADTAGIVALLRAQAAHGTAGGTVDTSPLANAPSERTSPATRIIRDDHP